MGSSSTMPAIQTVTAVLVNRPNQKLVQIMHVCRALEGNSISSSHQQAIVNKILGTVNHREPSARPALLQLTQDTILYGPHAQDDDDRMALDVGLLRGLHQALACMVKTSKDAKSARPELIGAVRYIIVWPGSGPARTLDQQFESHTTKGEMENALTKAGINVSVILPKGKTWDSQALPLSYITKLEDLDPEVEVWGMSSERNTGNERVKQKASGDHGSSNLSGAYMSGLQLEGLHSPDPHAQRAQLVTPDPAHNFGRGIATVKSPEKALARGMAQGHYNPADQSPYIVQPPSDPVKILQSSPAYRESKGEGKAKPPTGSVHTNNYSYHFNVNGVDQDSLSKAYQSLSVAESPDGMSEDTPTHDAEDFRFEDYINMETSQEQ